MENNIPKTTLIGAQYGAQRVEITTDLTRVCSNKLVISIHCIGLIVTASNVDLFTPTVIILILRMVFYNTGSTLLAVCVLRDDVYCPWGLG